MPDLRKNSVTCFVLLNLVMCLLMFWGCDRNDRHIIVSYYDNGKVWHRYNMRTKVSETFYPDGKLRCKNVNSSKDDPDATPSLAVDKETDVVSIAYYKRETCYDETGVILTNGILKGYLLNGIQNSEIPYHNGKPNGVAKYTNGQEDVYKDGLHISTRNFEKGKLSSEVIYHVGEKIIINEYDENGKIKPNA